ncbi:hypothetical protein DPX16_3724 [Anabarilius grahami]|uniref:Apolipoprotein L3 n=1 Tax=Anabarilius grahami TaxID=495550 RepID=A0A3N0YP59_ANAGA|nr:hypothetical protein DPX16_3724 [Anabarilius grahami]
MAPPNDPCRRNSKEHPPEMTYSFFKSLKNKLIELFGHNCTDRPILQHMERLINIMKTFEENFRCAATGSKHGKNSGIAGGVMMGLGLFFAPITLGASVVVGAAVATGGAIGSGVWKSKKSSMLTKCREDIKAVFQNKIFSMTDKMKDINQCIEKILSDINNPNCEVSFLSKYFASAYELSSFIRIYDIGGLAAQISETVRLTGTLTGIVDQIDSALENVSRSNDINAFSDTWNKIINQLQHIINAIINTKNGIDKIR